MVRGRSCTSDVETRIRFFKIDKKLYLIPIKLHERKSPIITLIDIQCTKEFCSVSAQFQLRTEIKTVNNNNIHLELLTAHL